MLVKYDLLSKTMSSIFIRFTYSQIVFHQKKIQSLVSNDDDDNLSKTASIQTKNKIR